MRRMRRSAARRGPSSDCCGRRPSGLPCLEGRRKHRDQADACLWPDRSLWPGCSVCAEQPGWDDLPADQRAQLKRRQGVPYPLQEGVTVIDPETMQPVAPRRYETIGEVMFRGNIVMKGYLKNEKATREAFAGGWFHTGDLGVVDEHGL